MMKFFGFESKAEKAAEARAAGINPDAISTLSEHRGSVEALTQLSNGFLASGSCDRTIKIWDMSRGTCELTLSGHASIVTALTQLTNGFLASGSYDRTIRIWDVSRGTCVSTLSGHMSYVLALTQLSNGFLASGSCDRTIKIWDVSRRTCESTLFGHTEYVRALTQLTNGFLASGSDDNTIKIWDVSRGTCESTLSTFSWFPTSVMALAVLSNGFLASGGSRDKTIKVWNVSAGVCVATLSGHTERVFALTLLSNGFLVSGSFDNTIKIWDVSQGRCVSTLSGHMNTVNPLTPRNGVNALTLLSNGFLASGSGDKTIKVWDLGLRPVPVQQKTASPRAAAPPENSKSPIATREGISVSPAVAQKVLLPPTPPKSAATTSASEASEHDALPAVGGLSLSQTAETIAFSELELGDELGRGGFGVVCEALWQGATQVAVKQLLGRLTPDLLEEFQRETNVHAGLRHPNIILLYGVCVESMKYAMVMEFMARGSLYDVLKNPAELPWSLRLSMALDLSLGLLYLHGRHIIHRDLKSLNVLVDGQMRAKVSDFGLSKIKLTTALMSRGGGGTTHWMAPELFRMGGKCNNATDVYATGIVFWEIASRKLPYAIAENQEQIKDYVKEGNRETMPAGTPAPFAALMTRCWAQRAEDRPNMNEVARDLRELRTSGSASEKASPAKSAAVDSGYAAFSRRPG